MGILSLSLLLSLCFSLSFLPASIYTQTSNGEMDEFPSSFGSSSSSQALGTTSSPSTFSRMIANRSDSTSTFSSPPPTPSSHRRGLKCGFIFLSLCYVATLIHACVYYNLLPSIRSSIDNGEQVGEDSSWAVVYAIISSVLATGVSLLVLLLPSVCEWRVCSAPNKLLETLTNRGKQSVMEIFGSFLLYFTGCTLLVTGYFFQLLFSSELQHSISVAITVVVAGVYVVVVAGLVFLLCRSWAVIKRQYNVFSTFGDPLEDFEMHISSTNNSPGLAPGAGSTLRGRGSALLSSSPGLATRVHARGISTSSFSSSRRSLSQTAHVLGSFDIVDATQTHLKHMQEAAGEDGELLSSKPPDSHGVYEL